METVLKLTGELWNFAALLAKITAPAVGGINGSVNSTASSGIWIGALEQALRLAPRARVAVDSKMVFKIVFKIVLEKVFMPLRYASVRALDVIVAGAGSCLVNLLTGLSL
jgi:membrane associated rhomboid family serine protease